MSFTIKCNKCGNEQEFTSQSSKFEENIGIDVYVQGSYAGNVIKHIEIECENLKCSNIIKIMY